MRGGTVGNFAVKARSASTTVRIGNMESSTIVNSASNPLARLRAVSRKAFVSSAIRRDPGQQRTPLLCQRGPIGGAVKQEDAELRLELLDSVSHRRLGAIHLLGRLREASG